MFTEEQIRKMLLSDLGVEERRLARQNALADQLRGAALHGGGQRDFGSQMSQALAGFGTAYNMRKMPGLEADAATARAKRINDIFAKQPPAVPVAPPPKGYQPPVVMPEEELP